MTTNALKGNEFVLSLADTYNGATYTDLAAIRATQLTLNSASVDITNKDSSGWQELLAGGGVRSAQLTFEGIYSGGAAQDTLISAQQASTHWNVKLTDGNGNTYVGAAHVDTLSFTGNANVEENFNGTLTFSGEVVYTAA